MKRILLCGLLLCATYSAPAQMKLIRKMFSEQVDSTRKPSFMPLPLLRYSQEVGLEFGLAGLYSTYMDKTDSANRSSNFATVLSYSTEKQYNISLKGDIWTKANAWHLIGEMRFRSTPFDFYGTGNQTKESDKDRLVQDQVKLLFDVEKNILPFTYTGASLGYEHYNFKDKEVGGIYNLQRGQQGGSALFIGFSQTYDTRNSNNYPTHGFFARLSYQYAPQIFSHEEFSGSQIKFVLRNFWSLSPKLVLGINGIYYTVQSSNTPFYLLPQLGNDEIMRGYYSGRYRDENLIAAQTELRYRLSNRFGVVAFGGSGRVFANGDLSLKQFKPSGGAGIRYFYDPAKGLSVRADYALGEKRSGEARQSGFYLSLAEAF